MSPQKGSKANLTSSANETVVTHPNWWGSRNFPNFLCRRKEYNLCCLANITILGFRPWRLQTLVSYHTRNCDHHKGSFRADERASKSLGKTRNYCLEIFLPVVVVVLRYNTVLYYFVPRSTVTSVDGVLMSGKGPAQRRQHFTESVFPPGVPLLN